MLTTPERRTSERARIPCHIPVELMDSSRSEQFEADAVDLSVGGLSLRAAQLPDVGSQLYCAFEAMPGGAQVLGRGEVVWRQPQGDEGGEFGLRFIEVDAKNQALIDEMVAERIARIEARFAQPEPVMASLTIENVTEPVTARLVHTGDEQALFEQPLEHFSVGKAVVAQAGASLVRGHISQVSVRMEGGAPRLMLTLDLARERSEFGEFMWNEPGSDTDPDVFAAREERDSDVDVERALAEHERPAGARQSSSGTLAGVGPQLVAAVTGGTLAGMGKSAAERALPAPIYARGDAESAQLPLFKREREAAPRATLPEVGGLPLHDGERQDVPDKVFLDEEYARELLSSDYVAQEHEASENTDPDLELQAGEAHDDAEEETPPAPWIVKLLGIPAMLTGAYAGLGDRLRNGASQLRSDGAQRIAGARGNLFAPKPRRVTSSQRDVPEHKQNLRVIVIGSLCILSLALLAYVLTPASGEEDDGPHRAEQAAHEAAEQTALTTAAANELGTELPNAAEGTEVSTLAATAAAPSEPAVRPGASVPNKPAAPPAASPKPSAAPAATTTKAPAPGPSLHFGQKQVPNARRFLVRMAEPVKGLTGSADAGGFSVVIVNNRALDRAAPLKSGNPLIEHAGIRNRKDNSAELSVRFASGKSPAYRVSGQGSILEILIAQ